MQTSSSFIRLYDHHLSSSYRGLKQWLVLSVCQRQGAGELRRAGVAWLFVATQPFSSFQWLWASLALANAFRAGPSANTAGKGIEHEMLLLVGAS
jgi:hypothetical protein